MLRIDCFVSLRHVYCVPNVAIVSGLFILDSPLPPLVFSTCNYPQMCRFFFTYIVLFKLYIIMFYAQINLISKGFLVEINSLNVFKARYS